MLPLEAIAIPHSLKFIFTCLVLINLYSILGDWRNHSHINDFKQTRAYELRMTTEEFYWNDKAPF